MKVYPFNNALTIQPGDRGAKTISVNYRFSHPITKVEDLFIDAEKIILRAGTLSISSEPELSKNSYVRQKDFTKG